MIPTLLVTVLVLVVGGLVAFLRLLGRKVVAVVPRRKTVTARATDVSVTLPRSPLTVAPGRYGAWFGDDFSSHALVGDITSLDDSEVTRALIRADAQIPSGEFEAQWTGHIFAGPAELGLAWSDVEIGLADGSSLPAWLFPASGAGTGWVIHVQGIRTSRLVTLRAVRVAHDAGFTSLVITYRGAGDGPPVSASMLGLEEWTDLRDAIGFARAQGASEIAVVAWSMGAGLALELARRHPESIDRLVLVCPATNWREIVQHAAKKAHVPRIFATATMTLMKTPLACRIFGLAHPLDVDRLAWTRPGSVAVPTVVVHSDGDDEIPFILSEAFANAHPGTVRLVQTQTAPHGWEANVDPGVFETAITAALTRIQN